MSDKRVGSLIQNLGEKILKGGYLSFEEALYLDEQVGLEDLPALFEMSSRIRDKFLGRSVRLCAIINAKSGWCGEDCGFCAQSLHHETQVAVYPLLAPDQVLEKAAQAATMGAQCFSLVTSGGKTETRREIDSLCETIRLIVERFPSLSCAASLGTISASALSSLKAAGLKRYHHNLETAESFFPQVCTTHTFEERKQTIEAAKAVGLSVCSGGIIGLGESRRQRLELAFCLRDLAVDSVPVNFLHPIAGTRYQDRALMSPLEALRSVAFFRLIMPKVSIQVCGGRQVTLRSLQSWIFLAGASGLMVGNFLTTKGGRWEDDQRMIQDLGFTFSSKIDLDSYPSQE
ncbi:MAG: biotin synthase BioB [bacterium]|nr:biotin synthase BioB [bacterium]